MNFSILLPKVKVHATIRLMINNLNRIVSLDWIRNPIWKTKHEMLLKHHHKHRNRIGHLFIGRLTLCFNLNCLYVTSKNPGICLWCKRMCTHGYRNKELVASFNHNTHGRTSHLRTTGILLQLNACMNINKINLLTS